VAKYPDENGKPTAFDIPTRAADPNEIFFFGGPTPTNCYAFALNLYGAPSLNPGFSTGHEIDGGHHSSPDFPTYCAHDGVELHSTQTLAGVEPFVDGQYYLAALFGAGIDMHWARIDSRYQWSEKMPGLPAHYANFQGIEAGTAPHHVDKKGAQKNRGMWFVAYYRVYPAKVALAYAAFNKRIKKNKCVIL